MTRDVPIEAVLFDVNGVLIDSMPLHEDLRWKLLEAAGVELTESEMLDYMGRGAEDFFRVVKEDTGADFDAEALAGQTRRAFVERVQSIPVMDDAAPTVRSLSERYAVAVATNDERRNVEAVLGRLCITDAVEAIVSIEDADAGKPHPGVYLAAADRLGVAPDVAVAVDDSPVGVEAARRAGMRVVGFRSSADVELPRATVTVEGMAELEGAIADLDRDGGH